MAVTTEVERKIIRSIISHLDPDDPNFNASGPIEVSLREIRHYLQAWVIPLAEALLDPPGQSRTARLHNLLR